MADAAIGVWDVVGTMGLGQPAVPPVLHMLSPDMLFLSWGSSPGPSHMGSEVLCHPRGCGDSHWAANPTVALSAQTSTA